MVFSVKKILFLIVLCSLMIALAQTASATDTFQTTDTVRLRSGPSTDADIIRIVEPGINIEVLEHDPAGWSRVRVGGAVGFIRSDFVTFSHGSAPVTFLVAAGVNFRTGPSTDAGLIRTLVTATSADVYEHDPAGWSKVRIGGTDGFIRSDFLALPVQTVQQASVSTTSQSQAQSLGTLRTVGGVNFRSGPSIDSSIIRTLGTGVAVTVLEEDSSGWSKVRVDGVDGFIRSDLLNASGGSVEFLEWSSARNVVRIGVPMRVVDVRTGISFNLQSFSKGGHADVEPVTRADTDAILRTRGGVWAWAPRPVWVTIGNRTIAAALNGMPHAGSTIADNGMNGHLCLHFGGTVSNNKSYERDLNNAVMAAWNATR